MAAYLPRHKGGAGLTPNPRVCENMVRVGSGGINKRFFVEQGVPQAAVDAMFLGPMTLRMSISGSAKFLTDARITGSHGRAHHREHAPVRQLVAAPRIRK